MKAVLLRSPSGKALLTLTVSWAAVWTLGALVQRLNLAWGLFVTELALIAFPAWLFLRTEDRDREPGCFHRPHLGQLFWVLLIAAGAIMAAVGRGLVMRQFLGYEPLPPDMKLGPAAVMSFGMLVLAPLCEELLFRAVLLRSFLQQMSSRNAVLLSAALFSLYHGSLQRLPETFILGLFLGMVFVRSGSYWLAVALHFLANLTGPGLFLLGQQHQAWFHPLLVLPLVLAACYGVYRLGEPLPLDLRGLRARLTWAVFGTARFPAPARAFPRFCRGLTSGLAAVALGMCVWGYVASGQRPGNHSPPGLQFGSRPPLSPPELKQLARRSGEAMAHAKSQEEQAWQLVSSNRILVKASHKTAAPITNGLRIELPCPSAKIVSARSEHEGLTWRQVAVGKYELLPQNDKGPAAGQLMVRELFVEYEFPLSALKREQNYRVPLHTLLPVQALRLKVVLDQQCGFEFPQAPKAREMWLFQGANADGKPNQVFGSCGFEVRPRAS